MKKLLNIRRNFQPHWVGDGFPVQSLFSYAGDTAATDPLFQCACGPARTFTPVLLMDLRLAASGR